MLEEILKTIMAEMSEYLNIEQSRHLSNILFINFHNKEIKDKNYNLINTGISKNEYLIKAFLMSKISTNAAKGTIKAYSLELKSAFAFIKKEIEDITAMDLRYYFAYLRENKKLKPNTIDTRMRILKSFFDFLEVEQLISKNPMKKIEKIHREKILKKPFTSKHMEKIRSGCKTKRERAIIELLYSTGVRVSELVHIDLKDIDFHKQELIVYGKGSKERKAYITDSAMYYLEEYLKIRIDEDLTNISLPLFVTKNYRHNRLSKRTVQDLIKRLGDNSGVSKAHPHRFRRTIATDLLGRGMPLEQVSQMLGHIRLDTTMIYCQVKDDQVKYNHQKYTY